MEDSPSLGESEVRLEGFEQPVPAHGRGNGLDGLLNPFHHKPFQDSVTPCPPFPWLEAVTGTMG